MRHILCLVVASVFLYGCGGSMQGILRDTGEQVPIRYTQQMSTDTLTFTLSDGETFKGKVMYADASTSIGHGTASGSASGPAGSATATATGVSVTTNYTGNMVALLVGNKGHTMRCSFKYADPTGYTQSGGMGVCDVSDGRVMDVSW